MKKLVLAMMILGFAGLAQAEVADIRCQAEFRVLTGDGNVGEVAKPMVKKIDDGRTLQFIVELEGRTFTLTGDTFTGDFMLAQTWGKGFTEGVLTSASFDSRGRMQISTVDTYIWFDPKDKDLPVDMKKYPNGISGSRIYKLVCNKALAK